LKKFILFLQKEFYRFLTGFLYSVIDFCCASSLVGGYIRPCYMKMIGTRIGKKVALAGNLKISQLIEVGEGSFINYGCYLDGSVKIGKYCLIGFNTNLISSSHAIKYTANQRRKHLKYSPPIIEDYVWIGAGCTILPGVTIGEGSIIGAGSVVTKNIPKNVIAVGNPCKILKSLDLDENRSEVCADNNVLI
jgi:acetyltransferase-like isoleucine patch superfamily enzyme